MACWFRCVLARLFTPEWLTAIGTVGACVIALVVAFFGKWMERFFFHPKLRLIASVKRPNSARPERYTRNSNGGAIPAGEAWFFRLEIKNESRVRAARGVQILLSEVERIDADRVEPVKRFSPMNLNWTHLGRSTRDLILPQSPQYCDFIHIGQPEYKGQTNEELETVPKEQGVICLDVEVPTSERGHLLEPGKYRCRLILAAENCPSQEYVVDVGYSGIWAKDEETMCDRVRGFWMHSN
jgi:hypothetical protein